MLNYDGRHLLEAILPSLAAQSYALLDVLPIAENIGVAAALNRGVTCARNHRARAASHADLIALFNNDVELDPDCVGELVAALDAHPAAGSDFFVYLEDVDGGFRARLAGYSARYEPRALGYHLGGATLGAINSFSLYHLRRNQIWLVAKNYPLASLIRHAPAVLAFNVHAVAMAVRQRRFGLVVGAYRDALRALPAMLRKRRAIQRTRAIGPRDLERVMRR